MNTERLLAQYEQIADAPDAIARLRRFILDLAVRGKLVPQDAGEEPASELLKRIAKEKARLVKAGEIANSKNSKPVSFSELAFSIPQNWQPVNIEHALNELQTGPFGSSLHQSDYRVGGTPVINPASIQNEQIVPVDKMAVDARTLQRLASFKLRSGDIVMARRGEMGRCAIVTDREAGWLCGTGSLILRPSRLIYARFLALLIGSPFGREYLGGSAVGSTMQNLNQSILLNLPFGLPPLAEQHRIVAKVDELMALCDQLEAARGAREAVRDRLAAASFGRLNASDPETLQDDAQFALDALPALTTRPDQIRQLREIILNLAVRGILVEQQAGDEPVSELLASIERQRFSMVNSSALRRIERVEPESDTPPFEAPEGWVWVFPDQLSSLSKNALTIGPFGSSLVKSDYRESGVPLVFVADVTSEFRLPPKRFIDEEKALKLKSHVVKSGDLVITKMGDPPGSTAIYPVDRPTGVVSADCIKWSVEGRLAAARFLYFAIRAQKIASQIVEITKGAAHQKVSLKRFRSIYIPLPPLAEQHRIVAKVDELMALCDRLEAGLTAAADTRGRLLDALLAEALAPLDAREMEAAE